MSDNILVVCPNLALDHLVTLERLRPGDVTTAAAEALSAGGKGLNVARALATFGTGCSVVGFLGGWTGDAVQQLSAADGIGVAGVRTATPTRIATVLRAAGGTTVVNGPGGPISGQEVEELRRVLAPRIARARVVVCSGSIPPGCPPGFFADVLVAAKAADAYTIVDTRDQALRECLAAQPDLVKVNSVEARAACEGLPDDAHAERCLAEIGAITGADVIITIGSQGLVARLDNEAHVVPAPAVRVADATGAGDTVTAVLAAAVAAGGTIRAALDTSVAAAAASAETHTPGKFHPQRVDELLRCRS